ncbi:MAG: alpha/beta fold hydrolase [Gammaproteobacteria bacterium]
MEWLLVALLGLISTVLLACLAAVYWRRRGAFFQTDDVRLHYRDEGEGEVVLLLHGFAVHSDLNWRHTGVLRRLRRHFRVITLDLRGHGLSGKPRESAAYGLELVHDVARLLEHLGIQQAHLVGYSLGGFVALKTADCHGARLRSVAVLGAGWERPDDEALFQTLAHCGQALTSGHAIPPLGPAQARPGLVYTWLNRLFTALFVDQRALGALVHSLHDLTLSEERLRALELPLCAIIGEQDYLRPGAERLIGRVPALEFHLIRGAGHLSLAWRGEMHQILEDFLRRHGRAT